MNKWVIGCFFTPGAYEEVFYKHLCKSLDYPKDERIKSKSLMVDRVPSTGRWLTNVAMKPALILQQLENLSPSQCLVFLDVDATVEQYPVLFDEIPEEYDIAYHTLSWKQWYGYETETLELLSGTMFFRNNDKVKELCRKWLHKAQTHDMWEQKALQEVIETARFEDDIKVYPLPLEYCYMKTRPHGQEPLVKIDPVILHHQVSRELKKKTL